MDNIEHYETELMRHHQYHSKVYIGYHAKLKCKGHLSEKERSAGRKHERIATLLCEILDELHPDWDVGPMPCLIGEQAFKEIERDMDLLKPEWRDRDVPKPCPECGANSPRWNESADSWQCRMCGKYYDPNGQE